MRLTAYTFSGYGSGETDFSTLLSNVPQDQFVDFDDVLGVIAGQITNPTPTVFVSLIIVGHSDRQDRSDFTCDQRRTSEIESARDRATSAWEWTKQRVNWHVVQSGGQASDWWETAPHVTWGLVFAAAGMLPYDPPTDDQRPLNRRVVVLASTFRPA
jgi:hypothetical protein